MWILILIRSLCDSGCVQRGRPHHKRRHDTELDSRMPIASSRTSTFSHFQNPRSKHNFFFLSFFFWLHTFSHITGICQICIDLFYVQWLRLLFSSKTKFKVGDARKAFGIHHPEPLLHFALCSGSQSDPAVHLLPFYILVILILCFVCKYQVQCV